jgi:hypothetical protein
MKHLTLTAVITTSAMAVSDAFPTTTSTSNTATTTAWQYQQQYQPQSQPQLLPRTPLHLPFPCLHAKSSSSLMDHDSSFILSSSSSSSSSSYSSSTLVAFASSGHGEIQSYLAPWHKTNTLRPRFSNMDGADSNRNSRYGGRAISGYHTIKSLNHGELGTCTSGSGSGSTTLGFDFGLNMISRRSDITASTTTTTTAAAAQEKSSSAVESSSSAARSLFEKERMLVDSTNKGGSTSCTLTTTRGKYIGQENDDVLVDSSSSSDERIWNGQRKNSCVPGWFPYTPTRSQIESLKVMELRDACHERGLAKVRIDEVYFVWIHWSKKLTTEPLYLDFFFVNCAME